MTTTNAGLKARSQARAVAQRDALSAMRRVIILTASAMLLLAVLLLAFPAFAQDNPNVRPPASAVTNAGPSANPQTAPDLGGNYDPNIWGEVRQGLKGDVSIPDKKAGVLVDSSGETWRNLQNGPISTYGAYGLIGVVGLLALFYLVRGRVRIDHGPAGWTIERFTNIERMGHWLLATSFIILAITGLNLIYGRDFVMPIIGKEAFGFDFDCHEMAAQLRRLRVHAGPSHHVRNLGPLQLPPSPRYRMVPEGRRLVRRQPPASEEIQRRTEGAVLARHARRLLAQLVRPSTALSV